jgi:hypothetical protein
MLLDDFGEGVILESILPDPFRFHQFNLRVLEERRRQFIMWMRQRRILSVVFCHLINGSSSLAIVYRK